MAKEKVSLMQLQEEVDAIDHADFSNLLVVPKRASKHPFRGGNISKEVRAKKRPPKAKRKK